MSGSNFDMLNCIAHIATKTGRSVSRTELVILIVMNTIHHW